MSGAPLICAACGVRLIEIAAGFLRCWICGAVVLRGSRS